MNSFKNRAPRGFTLIELLVVIGIIAVLAGGVGLALRGGNPDSAIRSAQGMIASTLSATRGQAALKQSYAKIIVQADSSKDNFLRLIRVVTSPDQATWTQAGGDIILPTGVYVVPSGVVNGLTTAGSGRRSTFFGSPAAVSGISDVSNSWLSSAVITPLGMVLSSGYIVVGSGRQNGPSTVVLDNYDSVRGVSVSRYGIANLINDATSFDY